jgi:hypothetical protein
MQGVEESSDSTQKKYIYTIPIDQQNKIPMLLASLEQNYQEIIIFDIEMNTLEDAFINIAKAEEKLHNDFNNDQLLTDKLDNDNDFERYLSISGTPNLCQQISGMFVRRMKQFGREPRLWMLLASPFITIIISFLMISAIIPKG